MTLKGYQFLFQELTFFEALTLLETAALLRVFPLGTRSSVARFWASSRFLHGCLALVSLLLLISGAAGVAARTVEKR